MTHKDLIGTLPMEHERWSGGIQKTFNFNCVQGEDGSLVSVTSPLLPSNSICRGHSGGRRDLEGESHRPDVMQDRSWDQSAYVMTWIRWSLVAEPRWWSAWLQVGVCPECAYSPWPQGAGKESNRARRTWGDQEADNQDHCPSTLSGPPTLQLLLRSPDPERERANWTIRLSPLWNSCWKRQITICAATKN